MSEIVASQLSSGGGTTPRTWSRLVVVGDSIPVASPGASPALDPLHRAQRIIAAQYPGVCVDKCVGGKPLYDWCHDAAAITAALTNWGGSGTPSDILIAMGYNDQSLGSWGAGGATDFGTQLRALKAAAEAQWPGVRVWGASVYTGAAAILPYNAEIQASFPADRFIDATTFGITAGDKIDSIHLRESGHLKWATGAVDGIGWFR